MSWVYIYISNKGDAMKLSNNSEEDNNYPKKNLDIKNQ